MKQSLVCAIVVNFTFNADEVTAAVANLQGSSLAPLRAIQHFDAAGSPIGLYHPLTLQRKRMVD